MSKVSEEEWMLGELEELAVAGYVCSTCHCQLIADYDVMASHDIGPATCAACDIAEEMRENYPENEVYA